MKKTLLTMAAAGTMAVGGFSVAQVAAAQSYGGETPALEIVEVDDVTIESVPLVPVQDAGEADDADGATEEDRERRGRHGRGCHLEAAADAIGVEVDELRAALADGESIADVATANDVDPDDVVDAMVAATAERLEEKVESGRLTQAEADERLAEKSERIADRVFDTAGESA